MSKDIVDLITAKHNVRNKKRKLTGRTFLADFPLYLIDIYLVLSSYANLCNGN